MIDYETPVENIFDILWFNSFSRYFLNVISVIGTTNHINFDESLKTSFKLGFIKAIKAIQNQKFSSYMSQDLHCITTIITEGTDFGVSHLVGRALDEDLNRHQDVRLIGVTNFRNISLNHSFLYKS